MNPNSQSYTPDDTILRAECERLTEQAFTEGLSRLCDQEQLRLYELWAKFPDIQQEFVAMQAIVADIKTHYTPETELKTDDWNALEHRITSGVVGERMQPTSKHSSLTLVKVIRRYGWLGTRLAAVFIVGLFIGRFFFPISQSTQNFTQHSFTAEAIRNHDREQAEVRSYLNDAHLLMLGVMAMNAECGLSNPHTLASQRERCVELLARSSRIQAGLQGAERQRMGRVLAEIESALAELAEVHPSSCNSMQIRQLQARTDDALCEVSSVLRERAIQ